MYRSVEGIVDSEEEAGTRVLPALPYQLESQSPFSDLPESTDSQPLEPITPSGRRKRRFPEVATTNVPAKRTRSPQVQEDEEGKAVDKDGPNGSPNGKKRRKKAAAEDYFDGLHDDAGVVPKNGFKGKTKAKAPQRGKVRTKPQPKEMVADQRFEEGLVGDTTGTNKKTKYKTETKATTKAKPINPGQPHVADSDDEVMEDETMNDPAAVPMEDEEMEDSSTAQPNANWNKVAPPQDAGVSPNSVFGFETVLICNFKNGQENTPLPSNHGPSPKATPSPVTKKKPAPVTASSFYRLNYGHSLANEEKPMTMREVVRKPNAASGAPSGIGSYLSFVKDSRTVLRKIAPAHARRKTPPLLLPTPPPPKKTKKQMELEQRLEEELEKTVKGWAALSNQERELLRKQKREMDMCYED